MQFLILKPNDPTPNPLIDCEVMSVPFPRWLEEEGSTPLSLAGTRLELCEVRHAVAHNTADNGRWSNKPTNPNTGSIDDFEGHSVGWQSKDRGHGHILYFQNLANAIRSFVRRSAFISGFSTAAKFYAEDSSVCKAANVDVADNMFVGWVLFGGRGLGAEDLVIERNVFFGDVTLGYTSRSRRIVFRNNVVFGNVQMGDHDDLVMTDNIIVTRPPYAPSGTLYGSYNFGLDAGWLSDHHNLSMSGNVIYADAPNVFNWRTYQEAYAAGGAIGDTELRPLSEFGPFERRVEIPERSATRVFRFDFAGVTVPEDAGRVLYPPPNPIGWDGPAPSLVPLDPCLGIWREMDAKDAQIERLTRSLALEQYARAEAEAGKLEAEAGKLEADTALADEIQFSELTVQFFKAVETFADEEDSGEVSETARAALLETASTLMPLLALRWRGRRGYTPRRLQEMETLVQDLNNALAAVVDAYNAKETERAAAVAKSDDLIAFLGTLRTMIADKLTPPEE